MIALNSRDHSDRQYDSATSRGVVPFDIDDLLDRGTT